MISISYADKPVAKVELYIVKHWEYPMYISCGSGWLAQSTNVLEIKSGKVFKKYHTFNIYSKWSYHPLGSCIFGRTESSMIYSAVAHFHFPENAGTYTWNVTLNSDGTTATYSGDVSNN